MAFPAESTTFVPEILNFPIFMKQKFLFMAFVAALIIGCKKEEPEINPQAKFSYTTDELKISFTNHSTNATSYEWDFGNGKTSQLVNPTITYEKEGTYHVSLKAWNNGKSHSTEQSVTVSYKKPKAQFTYKIEQPLKVVLTNTSSDATSYEWNFGDGTSSTIKNPIHTYKNFGVYKITLTAKNGTKTDTYQQTVTIEAPTVCYFSGFEVTKIPSNNVYYQIQLTDDYVLSKTTYVWTNWFLLSSANLPYTYMFNSPVQLNISNTYIARLYKRSSKPSGQADGKGDYSVSITSEQLKSYPEQLTWTTTNIGIKFYFQWK